MKLFMAWQASVLSQQLPLAATNIEVFEIVHSAANARTHGSELLDRTCFLYADDSRNNEKDYEHEAHGAEPMKQISLKGNNADSHAVTAIWNRILCCGIGLSGVRA